MTGRTFLHYKVLDKLGEGGMGEVYRAEDTRLKRHVALKFLPRRIVTDDPERQRLRIEAQAAAALSHPAIATVFAIEEADDELFIVMEYVEGRDLREECVKGALSIDEVLRIGTRIAEGLGAAHRKGIVHRDIKSANIMMTDDGRIKIMDFGLARMSGGTRITQAGSTVGTAAYMSPEQIRGEEADERSDLFSFGILLYEMTTGTLPFRGEFEAAVGYSILNEQPAPVRSLRGEASPELEGIINRCLEKDRARRYQSAEEVAAALASVRRPDAPSPPLSHTRARVSRKTALTGIALIVAALISVAVITLMKSGSGSAEDERRSIAVLPFANLSDSREDEYFADGITEDLIVALSKIGGFKVISRTSVMQYKGVARNIRTIGEELGVTMALEGSVRRSDQRVVIVAQLVDVMTDENIWSETFDREQSQVVAVQGDVARSIAIALKGRLSQDERGRLETRSTENFEAYNYYLLGRFHWNKRTADDLVKAIGYFEDAIELDSSYARAYSGLADAYSMLLWYAGWAPGSALPPARRAATRALNLDPELGEAFASMALVQAWLDWDWKGAEENLRKAITLAPNYASAYQWLGHMLAQRGYFEEARSFLQRAIELDPLSPIINVNYGDCLYLSGDYDSAIIQYRKALEIDPGFGLANEGLGLTYLQKEMYTEALDQFLSSGAPQATAAYTALGRTAEADSFMSALRQRNRNPMDVASAYAGLGDRDNAFMYLQRALDERIPALMEELPLYPYYQTLRSDDRFAKLMSEIEEAQ